MKKKIIAGWVISLVPIFILTMSAFMKATGAPELLAGLKTQGIPLELVNVLLVLEIVSLVLYAIPQTALIGAIFVTGYMGGAIFSHLRIGEAVGIQVLLPILAWLGLFLRNDFLKEFIPFRK